MWFDNGTDESKLLNCAEMKEDVHICQKAGVKILLSIGGVHTPGGPSDYDITTEEEGEAWAKFLWESFGKMPDAYTGPRPLDFDGEMFVINGFDFDLEYEPSMFDSDFRPPPPPFSYHLSNVMLSLGCRLGRHDQRASGPCCCGQR